MSRMRQRIMNAGAMGDFHPIGTGATVMTMPLALVEIHEDGMRHQELHPIYTADGAPVPATARGSWGQVHAAGHP